MSHASKSRPQSESTPIGVGSATGYALILPTLLRVAREHGYALGIHGTMTRDFDLIAAPWTEEATDDETLARALCAAVGGKIHGAMHDQKTGKIDLNPVTRPHGRKGWVIHLGGPYLDLSVMPRSEHNGRDEGRAGLNQSKQSDT